MNKLPDSDTLAKWLLEAADEASDFQSETFDAWQAARIARVNRDLLKDDIVATAYAEGRIDGKNEQQRSVQLAVCLASDTRLADCERKLQAAEATLKRTEDMLETARIYRSALHDLVDLRVAELGATTEIANRAMSSLRVIESVLRYVDQRLGRDWSRVRVKDWRETVADRIAYERLAATIGKEDI